MENDVGVKLEGGIGRIYHQSYGRDAEGKIKYAKTWMLRFNYRGRRFFVALNTDKLQLAKRKAKAEIAKVVRGEPVGADANRVKFEHLVELILADYDLNQRKSKWRLQDAIDHLAGMFAEWRAVDVTCAEITRYVDFRMKEEKASPATVHAELSALKRMFHLGIRAGLLGHRPAFPTISLNNARKGFFEEPEFQAVCTHLSDEVRPVVQFAYLTGWRKSEITSLQWCQIDFYAGVMRLETGTTKNNEGRVFPFAVLPELKDLLLRQRSYTDAVEQLIGKKVPYVFHRNGRPIRSFKGEWHKAVQLAEIPGRIIHDFRRTAVRNLERAGVSRSVAMALTGHKTESVYRRYAIVSESDLAVGVAKLAALHGGPQSPTLEPEQKKAVGAGGNVVAFARRR